MKNALKRGEATEIEGGNLELAARELLKRVKSEGGDVGAASQAFIQNLLSQTYNHLLEAEVDEHLGYFKGEQVVSGNSRNGKL